MLQTARGRAKRGALNLRLTEPETVPMTPEQHDQAVSALSAMILTWLQRPRGPVLQESAEPGGSTSADNEAEP